MEEISHYFVNNNVQFKAIEYVHEDVIALDMFCKQIATVTRTYCLIIVSLAQLKQARLVSSLVTCTNRELNRIVYPHDMKLSIIISNSMIATIEYL